MCLICGENNGYNDAGQPCWGCNFTTCECGQPIPYDVPCVKCGKITPWTGGLWGTNLKPVWRN